MKLLLFERDALAFDQLVHDDIDLRIGGSDPREIASLAASHAASATDSNQQGAWSVVALIARASAALSLTGNPELLSRAVELLAQDRTMCGDTPYVLATLHPAAVPDLLTAVLSIHPQAMPLAINLARACAEPYRTRCETTIATYPLASVREHYFALLGKHQRMLPPGAIERSVLSKVHGPAILRLGIDDVEPTVRRRALAVAIGMNLVGEVRATVLSHADDPVEGVRQYAIVALGTLDDAESLARIVDKLEAGTQPEMTSAIWALARRPDGLARVLPLAADDRDWVRRELLGALADVAAPMTDDQIAALTATIVDEKVPRVIERHLDRTRHDGREYGPDGGMFAVRATEADK